MSLYIHSDENQVAPLSKSVNAVSSGSETSHRAALRDITNSHRLNKGAENPSVQLPSNKGHKRSKAVFGIALDCPKFTAKFDEFDLGFSAEDYSKADPELDDAANEGSQRSAESFDSETLENTQVNAPYLDRLNKKGLKEILNAVVYREVQPIDESFQGLKLDYYLPPRTSDKRVQFSIGHAEEETQVGAQRVNFFDGDGYNSTEQLTGWPFSREEKNKIIEHWLESSSSLWNSEIRLSMSRIGATGDELKINELETAAQFDELNLPSPLDRLISAIEHVGKHPETEPETKEVVVDVLRSPEMASRFKELNLPIVLDRFNLAINHVLEEQQETEISKAYNLARVEIEDGPPSVTPESFGGFSGYFIQPSDSIISAQLNKLSITNLDNLPIRRVGFVTAVEVKNELSDSSLSIKEIKIPKKVTFADEVTIIGDDTSWNEHDFTSLHSNEVIKQAKFLGRASSNVVTGMEHIQKHLFGMDIPTRMTNLDQQFSSHTTSKANKRDGLLLPHKSAPLGLNETLDEALDTPFNISLDGFISGPLPSTTCTGVSRNPRPFLPNRMEP